MIWLLGAMGLLFSVRFIRTLLKPSTRSMEGRLLARRARLQKLHAATHHDEITQAAKAQDDDT